MGIAVVWLAAIEAAVIGGTWLQSKATRTPWLGCWFLWHLAIPLAIATGLALWLASATARCAGRAVLRWSMQDDSTERRKGLPRPADLRTFVGHGR